MHVKTIAYSTYFSLVLWWIIITAAPNYSRRGSATYFGGSGSHDDGPNYPPSSRRTQSEEVKDDPLLTWIECHPWTVRYLLLTTTVTMILTIALFISEL